MELVNLKLGRNFFKGSMFGNYPLTADVEFKSSKEPNKKKKAYLTFDTELSEIHIGYVNEEFTGCNPLDVRERFALLESIFVELCTFAKSLAKFTVIYEFGFYKFIDHNSLVLIDKNTRERELQTQDIPTEKSILEELLASEIRSTNQLVYNLQDIYQYILRNKVEDEQDGKPARYNFDRKKEFSIPVSFEMKRTQKIDIRYFTNSILYYFNLQDKWMSEYDKANRCVVIKKRTR